MTGVGTSALQIESHSPTGCWQVVQRFMLRSTGVVLHEDQAYLIEARLAPVAKHHGFARIADFVTAACAAAPSSALAAALIDAMTTHETSFFRDPSFWKCLEDTVLPRLAARARAGASVRIWSAACSTGQEPYSLTMLLAERFPELAERVEIIATDISELALERARIGTFTALEVNRGLSAARLVRHFEQSAGGFRVKQYLRRGISWSAHNLLGSRPDPMGCDLVLCRNVLFYFGDTDRAAAARRLYQATVPGGVIGIGTTETLREQALAPGLYIKAG